VDNAELITGHHVDQERRGLLPNSRAGRKRHEMAADDKVVIGQTHGDDDPESVLIGYLLGVEALRTGKQVVMWLTKNGIYIATEGYVDGLSVSGAPSIKDLHAEYVERGGRLFACPSVSRPAISNRRSGCRVPKSKEHRRSTSSPKVGPWCSTTDPAERA
jgi:predicted peroxiredoxin